MTRKRKPTESIAAVAAEFKDSSDAEVLAALAALPALADETDPCWKADDYWEGVAYRYLGLADVACERRLRAAIPLLLDRACYGDPGEIMRGLRHNLEAIVEPEWDALADLCLAAAQSPRLGTRLWAIDQLLVLDDPRAEPVFRDAVRTGPEEIAWRAEVGLERLGQPKAE